MIKGSYVNGELSLLSKTIAQNDVLKHVAELKHKKGQLSMKSDGSTTGLGKALRCKAELDVMSEEARLKVETQADDATHRAYSLLTGSLNSNGLEMNIEGLLNFEDGRGTHKGTLTFGANGLTTSCMTTIEGSTLTLRIPSMLVSMVMEPLCLLYQKDQHRITQLSSVRRVRFHPKKCI